jgi:hypothetical protein
MVFEPKLLPSQFDNEGKASVEFEFNGKPVNVIYSMDANASAVKSIMVDGALVSEGTNVLPKDKIGGIIEVELD